MSATSNPHGDDCAPVGDDLKGQLREVIAGFGRVAAVLKAEREAVPRARCCEHDTDGDGNCPFHSAGLTEDQQYIASLRGPLLNYFGTTDPSLLVEVWKEQARAADERNSTARAATREQFWTLESLHRSIRIVVDDPTGHAIAATLAEIGRLRAGELAKPNTGYYGMWIYKAAFAILQALGRKLDGTT